MVKRSHIKPQQDAGWGLIFRLNDLWRQIESYAPKGEYDKWNFKLDRIWCNLLYREHIEVEKGEDEKIINIKLSIDDKEEKEFLDDEITAARHEMNKMKKQEDNNKFLKAKRKYYNSLMLKDVWLRKFMMGLGLYLKEIEYDPSKAIYGGSG